MITRSLVLSVAIVLLGMTAASASPKPLTYTCLYGGYRAGDVADGVGDAVGVRGYLRTPYLEEVGGIGVGEPSAADVAVVNGPGYVQVGWYVGSANGLPFAGSPRLWVAENIPGTRSEVLRAGPAIPWNSYDLYAIHESLTLPGYYDFYLNHVALLTDDMQHLAT